MKQRSTTLLSLLIAFSHTERVHSTVASSSLSSTFRPPDNTGQTPRGFRQRQNAAFVLHSQKNIAKGRRHAGLRRPSLLTQLCPECETRTRNHPSKALNYHPTKSHRRNGQQQEEGVHQPREFLQKVSLTEKNDSTYGLDKVELSFLPSDDGASFKSLPLVVTPKLDASLEFLSSFLAQNRHWVDEMMLRYGAILFRGFGIASSRDFEAAVRSYQPRLNNSYRGTSPRVTQDGTEYVFSAADVPANYPIAQHIEMSFLAAPPQQLFFGSMKAPKKTGGETALADFRKVYKDISPALREKLLSKKIRYRRTHRKVGSRFTYDVADMQSWPEVFGTSDKSEVERMGREEGMPVSWEGPNGDTFVSVYESEPFQLHPVTHEPVWFNHAQVFHWTTFPMELLYAFLRTREWRLLFHGLLVSAFSLIKYGLLGHKMALDASFGDGTPITAGEMHEIRRAIHKNMVFNRWQLGDMLFIDNFSTSHGRQPTYDRSRKVVVAWSDPLEKSNQLTSSSQQPQ